VAAQDINDRFCGMTDPEILDVIEREWGSALPASYAERVALIIEENFLQSLTAIEGVAEALVWLPLPACVASSSTLQEIRRKTRADRSLEPLWRKPVQRDNGHTR
jgi:beta-phosphoglucomutase-like phosphatase (HAD superfamily)